MRSERVQNSVRNFSLALASLEEFVAEPDRTNRDKAGIFQAFEFTYELAWKTFQRLAQNEGLQVASPRQAFSSALQAGFIPPEEEPLWIAMMQDRNLTSHTYHESLATEIVQRIRTAYLPVLKVAVARLALTSPPPSPSPPVQQ
jgi:nucleotidyltransferase substrate binding protein (TIGR01987 family)